VNTPPSAIPTRHHAVLTKYRKVLPAAEYAALEAWLSTFYPFQLDWLLDQSSYAVANKSRQIGMSHSTAAQGVLWGVFHGELTTFISVGDRESEEVLEKAKGHRKVLTALGSRMAAKREKNNASQIDFQSGGRIIALPSSGGRSFTGNVFLDEYAYQQHAAQVWDAALAVTLHGFRARVASTPNGIGNDFEQLWSDPVKNKGWSRHEFPLQRALDDGMHVDIEKCWQMAKGDKRLFDQLFNCKFLDGELQYIPSEAVKECSVEKLDAQGDCFAGLDIGRSSDRTELVIVRKDKAGVRWQQLRKSCKRTDSKDIFELAQLAFGPTWNARKLCVDSTGMGVFPAEQLQKRFGEHRVEPVSFTLKSKEELATGLYSGFVEHTVRIDEKDETLRDDICSVRRIVSEAGNVKYDAPHTEKGHADSAWALALALRASGGRVPTYANY
jgi:phage FluMu gp28-like protein